VPIGIKISSFFSKYHVHNFGNRQTNKQTNKSRTLCLHLHRRRHYAVIGAAISVNAHSPACLSFHPPPPLSVLWELHGAIDFYGKSMRSSSEFSEGSFKIIIYGKLLRFNDIYGVSCLTAATNTNAADNRSNSSYLTERILPSVIGRRKRVHNGVDVQFISSVL